MVRQILLGVVSAAFLAVAPSLAGEQRVPILSGSVAVQAAAYVAYPVIVDTSTMTGAHIIGHVTASVYVVNKNGTRAA